MVEETLAGRSGNIKEYTVATSALNRPRSFDPQADPSVRVLAGRLRMKLDLYYATDGRSDPIRISMPKGRYVPVFEVNPQSSAVRSVRSYADETEANWRQRLVGWFPEMCRPISAIAIYLFAADICIRLVQLTSA